MHTVEHGGKHLCEVRAIEEPGEAVVEGGVAQFELGALALADLLGERFVLLVGDLLLGEHGLDAVAVFALCEVFLVAGAAASLDDDDEQERQGHEQDKEGRQSERGEMEEVGIHDARSKMPCRSHCL